MIRGYINDQHDNWEDLLDPIRFAYCNSVNSSSGFSPWFIVYGRDPALLIDRIMSAENDKVVTAADYVSQLLKNLNIAYQLVRANLSEARRQHKEQYDKRAKDLKYEVGDRVLLDWKGVVPSEKNKKWLPKFEGPYRVVQIFDNGTAEILGEGVSKRVNRKRLIPFFETMLWKDEPCLDIKRIPIGTSQFQHQSVIEEEAASVHNDLGEKEWGVEDEVVKETDQNSGRQAKMGEIPKGIEENVEEPGEVRGEADTPATGRVAEIADRGNKHGLRSRQLLKPPHWLDDHEE